MATDTTTTSTDTDTSTNSTDTDKGTDTGTDTGKGTDDRLGEGGIKALEAEREARRAAEKAARDAQAELDKIRKAGMSEQERAVAEAKAAGRNEALAEVTDRLVRSEIRAAAAGKLADPGDAAALLGDLKRFVKDGDVDDKAIASAIDELVKAKPYLAPAGSRRTPLPSGDTNTSNRTGFDINAEIRRKAGRY
jgi:hypothetical protein